MDRINVLLENSKRAVRYWWLLAVVGGALLAAGILIFAYPNRGYLALATLFGWLMFLSGILEAALSAMNRHFVTGRGWMAVGGLIEIILGLILIFNVSLSEITLPVVLGFWLLMRAFATIGLGGDMNALEIPGAGWTVFTGILLLLCAVWILLQPLVFGRTAVLVWVSISLLFAGTGACSLAFQLRCSHPNDGGREH